MNLTDFAMKQATCSNAPAPQSRSEGKIVSLFEPSAEVIRKGKASKPTEFGKLVKLQEPRTRSSLIMRFLRNGPAIWTC